ncbi:MAG: rod shape-determining protein MreD [Acidimicrobiales bacterium]|nr:rod shape-determining protein MreD [Actinomycetota bacterium]
MGDIRFRGPLVLVTAMMLHTAVLNQIRIAGVMPDLMLLLAIAVGLEAGASYGAVTGFITGMVADLFLPTPLGMSALVFSVMGYATGVTVAGLLRATWWFPMATAFGGSSLGVGLFALAGTMLGEPDLLNRHLPTIMLIVGITNGLLVFPTLRVVRWALANRTPSSAYAE